MNAFWNQVVEKFNNQSDGVYRNKNMVTGKWARLSSECKKFNDIYKHLQCTSQDDNNRLQSAKNIFQERFGGKSFQYVHMWFILRNHPKWDEWNVLFSVSCLSFPYSVYLDRIMCICFYVSFLICCTVALSLNLNKIISKWMLNKSRPFEFEFQFWNPFRLLNLKYKFILPVFWISNLSLPRSFFIFSPSINNLQIHTIFHTSNIWD